MDPALVIRARDGDDAAFRDLVEAMSGRMLGLARLVLRGDHTAEEAVQEAFIEAWRGLPRLREPERFEAWLRRLTLRACFDHGRREGRHRAVTFAAPAAMSVEADWQGTFALRDELDRGLCQLTTEQRAVLVLTYYVDLPLHESAEALGIPLGTMKSRLDRARSALRSALAAQERTPAAIQERPA